MTYDPERPDDADWPNPWLRWLKHIGAVLLVLLILMCVVWLLK